MVASLGEAFTGLVLIVLKVYPVAGFNGICIVFLRVVLFAIGFL